jgi:hypothetical protein
MVQKILQLLSAQSLQLLAFMPMVKKCKKIKHQKLEFKKQQKVSYLMVVQQLLSEEEKFKVVLGV